MVRNAIRFQDSLTQSTMHSVKETKMSIVYKNDSLHKVEKFKLKIQENINEFNKIINHLISINFQVVWEFLIKPFAEYQRTKVLNEQIIQMLLVLET